MKYKVKLTHSVELVVDADSLDDIQDWLNEHTPTEAKELIAKRGGYVNEDYTEEVLYKEHEDIIADINLKERQIPLEWNAINCCNEVQFTDDGLLEFMYELRFDVDKYFGTDTRDKDDTLVNFYTCLHEDGDITAAYVIDFPEEHETHRWLLTPEEKQLLGHKMQEHCMNRYGENMLSMLERMREEYDIEK